MNEEQRGDFATFGGYLCSLAGEIPAVSDHIVVPDYIFTIVQVRDFFVVCVGLGSQCPQSTDRSFVLCPHNTHTHTHA